MVANRMVLCALIALTTVACSDPAPVKKSVAATGATGFTAVTVGDDNGQRRFWVNFNNSAKTWAGGHTAPSTGVLPVSSGVYQMSAAGVVLKNSAGQSIGQVNGFNSLTSEGEAGNGAIQSPPVNFTWRAIR